MKFILILLFLFPIYCGATNYYVSTSGNDALAGTSPATAWKTLAKANASVFSGNDSLLLKRGDIFFGAIIVNRSYMNFGAYGSGPNPIIKGSIPLTSWTSDGGGIYSTPLAAKYKLNLVTIDSMPQYIARYPNDNNTNGGFLTFKKVTDSSIIIIPGASALRNVIRAKVLNLKAVDYRMDRDSITNVSVSGDTVYYVRGSITLSPVNENLLPVKDGYGAFYSRDSTFLDTLGEYFYNTATSRLKMYFGVANPASFTIEAAVVDTLFVIGNKVNIFVQDIDFYNAGFYGISSSFALNTKIQRCNIRNSGGTGIHTYQSDRTLIDSVTTDWCLSNGINNENNFAGGTNGVVSNCIVKNTGEIFGMGSFNFTGQYRGIVNGCRDTATVEYCTVTDVGKSGIVFNGNTARVRYNVVNRALKKFDDEGGIYTYVGGTLAAPGITYTDRVISNNIVSNCGFASTLFGKAGTTILTSGVYLDGRTMNTSVLNNIVFGWKRAGLHMNNPTNVTVYGNIFYADTIPTTAVTNSQRCISFFKLNGDTIRNLTINKNTCYIFQPTVQSLVYHAITNTYAVPLPLIIPDYLNMDSNYFNYPGSQCLRVEAASYGVAIPNTKYTLAEWQANFMVDANTTKLNNLPKYKTRLEYNTTKQNKTVTLDANYRSVTNQLYSGSFVLAPFTGILLFYDSPTIPVVPPVQYGPVRLKIRRG